MVSVQVYSVLNKNAVQPRTATNRQPTSPSQWIGIGCLQHSEGKQLIFWGLETPGHGHGQAGSGFPPGRLINSNPPPPPAKADQLGAAAWRAVSEKVVES